MKKIIILLCAFLGTLHIYAEDDVPAILFFHNDSVIQSFLRSDVDSMRYSYIDINGEKQNEVATQLVYLKDTIIQIPLAEIDSVVYTPPSYSYFVITRSPKNIGHFKATLCGTFGGKIAPDAVISDTGFLISFYNEKGDFELLKVSAGQSVIGDFEKEIDFKKLEYGCRKIYYYKAYAVVNHIMYIGAERTFFLNDIYLSPYGEDVQKEPTEAPVCSATIYGELFLGNEKEIEEAGFPMGFFVSKKDNTPTAESDDVIRIDGSFNDNNLIEGKLNGLEPGTKYYYSPFIETCKMEIGGTGSFITPPQIIVTTGGFETKATTAKFSLTIDVKMYERQLDDFPVGIQILGSRYSSDDQEYKQFDYWHYTTPHQDFSGIVYNLIPNARYSYRAYADINGKKYYGEWVDFDTKDLEVRTYDAITPISTMADISGELMEEEAMKIGEYYGFYYDTQPNVGINSMILERQFSNLDISPKFSETLTDLDPDITYYYRAFVTYKGIIYFGEIKKIGDIVVKTYDATDITTNSAHITGEVMNKDINFEGWYYGLIYYRSDRMGDSDYIREKFTSKSGLKFSWDLTRLTPETTYCYKVYVFYNYKTYYGEEKQFTTGKEDIVVVTDDASSITSKTAHLKGEVMNKNSKMKGEEYGFYYGTEANFSSNPLRVNGFFADNDNLKFDCGLIDLIPETTYYYRAYVTYKGQTFYGDVKQFVTEMEEGIVIRTNDPEMVTSTTAFLSGEILSANVNLNGETCGFFYKRKGVDEDVSYHQYELSGDKYYGYLKKLIPNTTYYYRAFIIYKDQYYLGEVKELTTKSAEEEQGYAEYDSKTGTLTFRYGIMPERDGFYDIYSAGWSPNKLKKVVFEPSFAKAYPYDTSGWFSGQGKLKEIVGLQYLNTSCVINMSHMFYGCDSLRSLDLSSFNTSKVTSMKSMFEECDSLESINLSGFDTSNVTSMTYMFYRCSNLKTLDISSFNTSKVKRLDFTFGWCKKLKTIYVGTGWSLEGIYSWLFETWQPMPGFGRDIFYGSSELVGGAGFKYSGSSSNDYKLAHIDEGSSNPGVFTTK